MERLQPGDSIMRGMDQLELTAIQPDQNRYQAKGISGWLYGADRLVKRESEEYIGALEAENGVLRELLAARRDRNRAVRGETVTITAGVPKVPAAVTGTEWMVTLSHYNYILASHPDHGIKAFDHDSYEIRTAIDASLPWVPYDPADPPAFDLDYLVTDGYNNYELARMSFYQEGPIWSLPDDTAIFASKDVLYYLPLSQPAEK